MALAFDAAASGSNSSASQLIFPHTCTGANRLLDVGGGCLTGLGVTVNSATYNAVAMTSINNFAQTVSFGNELKNRLFQLIAPATGANNVVVNFSGATLVGAISISYTDAHQTTPHGTPVQAGGTTGSPSATVASAAGEIVMDFVVVAGITLVVGAGQTSRQEVDDIDGLLAVGCSTEPGAASNTMTWTYTDVLGGWTTVAVAVKPASASTAVTPASVNMMGVL